MSKYALDCLPYNTELTEVTWENCTLRKWLNEKFYNAAFNKTEKAMIRKTTVQNKDNPYYGTKCGNDTKDKVFLLSIEDALKDSYGFDTNSWADDINRRCAPSSYAVVQGADDYRGTDEFYITSDNKGVCTWWLRSPGYDSEGAADVYKTGFVDANGDYGDYGHCAVRPVMVLKLKS